MRALNPIRFPLLALGLAFAFGCSADSPSSPTAPPSNPVPPATGVNVSVSASTASLEVGDSATSAQLADAKKRKRRALADLTQVWERFDFLLAPAARGDPERAALAHPTVGEPVHPPFTLPRITR